MKATGMDDSNSRDKWERQNKQDMDVIIHWAWERTGIIMMGRILTYATD